jgi:FkbM family methyltransferase
MTLKRALSQLRQRVPSPLKRFARRFALVNQLLPPLEGGELAVRLASRDLLRPGEIAFDVGANVGSHTVFMARLVGRRGQVHAFEPNAACRAKLETKLRKHRITNCRLVPGAVMETSGGSVQLYIDPRPEMEAGASTVIEDLATAARFGTLQFASVRVPTISLDDYCVEVGVHPVLVKMDIENAEIFALRGATRLLEVHRPHIIVEFGNEPAASEASLFLADNPVLTFLEERGYELVDLSLWQAVRAKEYRSLRVLRNILAIHGTRKRETPYARLAHETIAVIRRADLRIADEGAGLFESSPMSVEPGRYVASFDVEAEGNPEVELACFAEGDRLNSCRFEYDFVQLGLQHLVFEVDRPAPVRFAARRWSADGRLRFSAVTVKQIRFEPRGAKA